MPVTSSHELENTLFEGYKHLGAKNITFTKYVRRVLPVDGWVFWVKSSLIEGEVAPFSKVYLCSTHIQRNQTQEATKTNSISSIGLTVNKKIEDLHEVNQSVMWLGEYQGVKFSFNAQANYYEEANIFHYAGDAVYIENTPNIIDDIEDLDLDLENGIVTNCIPIFITLNQQVQIYPAFLAPTNLKPPYATIEVKDTRGIAAGQSYNPFEDSSLLSWDKVELTIYGLRKKQLSDFLKYLENQQLVTEAFGMYWLPSVQNENVPQSEINVLTNKKVLNFDVSYTFNAVRSQAEAFIRSVTVDFFVKEFEEVDTLQDSDNALLTIEDVYNAVNSVVDFGG
jgi:hypothetical protein